LKFGNFFGNLSVTIMVVAVAAGRTQASSNRKFKKYLKGTVTWGRLATSGMVTIILANLNSKSWLQNLFYGNFEKWPEKSRKTMPDWNESYTIVITIVESPSKENYRPPPILNRMENNFFCIGNSDVYPPLEWLYWLVVVGFWQRTYLKGNDAI
jgi:hypothetical protein